jgi:hypothetical protein
MKRTEIVLLVMIILLSVFTTNSCITPAEASSICRKIEVDTTYNDEISAFSNNHYRFTPTNSGIYIISVTGVDSNLDWYLCDNVKHAFWMRSRKAIVAQENPGMTDEVNRTPVLNAGQEYYLVVIEWDRVYGDYVLSIVAE